MISRYFFDDRSAAGSAGVFVSEVEAWRSSCPCHVEEFQRRECEGGFRAFYPLGFIAVEVVYKKCMIEEL